jgi:hypothetical protein
MLSLNFYWITLVLFSFCIFFKKINHIWHITQCVDGTGTTSQIKKHFKDIGVPADIKYIDPTYMVRACRANASDAILCTVLGQNAVRLCHFLMCSYFTCVSIMYPCYLFCKWRLSNFCRSMEHSPVSVASPLVFATHIMLTSRSQRSSQHQSISTQIAGCGTAVSRPLANRTSTDLSFARTSLHSLISKGINILFLLTYRLVTGRRLVAA